MEITIELFENWLRAKGLSRKTIEEYLYYFSKFMLYPCFNQENVSYFLSSKSNQNPVSRAFLISYQKFLKIHYKQFDISGEDLVEISEVELPKITGRKEQIVIRPLLEQDIKLLEEYMETEEDKLKLLISFYCGLRIQEMLTIRISSFNWDYIKNNPEKPGEVIVYGKGGKEAPAFVPSFLNKRISKFIRDGNFSSLNSFIFMKGIKNPNVMPKIESSERVWEKKLKNAGIRSGLIKKDNEGKIIHETDIWPHRLRHSFGYFLRSEKNLDIRDIKEAMRHSNISNTERYVYVDKEKLKEKIYGNSEVLECSEKT